MEAIFRKAHAGDHTLPAASLLCGLVVLTLGGCLSAASTETGVETATAGAGGTIGLDTVAIDLQAPTALAAPDDGTGRLFILEQTGSVVIIDGEGDRMAAPFIDLRDRMVQVNSAYDERGLLGIALHPEFASNGRVFLYYSAPLRAGAPEGWDHTGRLSELAVDANNPDRLDPATEKVLLEVDQPYANHNGGQLAFGEDGMLYIGLGDGGSSGDPQGFAQNLDSLLGKILRIDVDSDSSPYGIPPDNPFAGGGGLPEIYAYGLRNPYRFSFDAEYGLIAADVGQDMYEEINLIVPGGNYGWNSREGFACYSPPSGCLSAGLLDPMLVYDHSVGLSVIGGYVYRGDTLPSLQGRYIFGDWSQAWGLRGSGQVFVAEPDLDETWQYARLEIGTSQDGSLGNNFVTSFGTDATGNIYVLTNGRLNPTGTEGRVFRLVPHP